MTLKRKWAWGLAVLALLVAVVVRTRSAVPAQKAAVQVLEVSSADLATAEEGELSRSVSLTGLLQPLRQAVLTAEVEGRVDAVDVRAGESVSAGRVMARLDTRDLAAHLAEQQANTAGARAQLELAERTQRRNEELMARKFLSANSLDSSRSSLDAARETLKARQAQLDLARQALDKATVRAPIAGVVAERRLEPGQHVGLNAPMFSIVDLSRLEFVAKVPVSAVGAIRVGQLVNLSAEGFTEPVSGRIERISPVVDDATRMIPLYLQVTNPGQRLKAGMVVKGSVAVGGGRGVSL
ncbi:MAG: efflux RND transporter periplasmic adaptor subunit, partial [Zoogloea sp.]|nr:efflux RND transporter periplasmic adaptor subunit [Zoogloea sp.]